MAGARTNDRLVRVSDMEALMCRWCNQIRVCRAAEKDSCRCISDIRMTATAPTGKESTRLHDRRMASALGGWLCGHCGAEFAVVVHGRDDTLQIKQCPYCGAEVTQKEEQR